MHTTWILVADRVRARLFSPGIRGAALTEIEDFVNPGGRNPARDAGRGRPARTNESMGHASHAIQPHTSPEDKFADRFAHELNKMLERGRVEHRYERLVLAAPPRFMGALHQSLGQQVRNCVVAEVGRDLTSMTPAQIQAQLAPQLAGARAPLDSRA